MNLTFPKRRLRAFTLVELLVVILIIAILASLVVPRIMSRADQAKLAKAESDISTLRNMLNNFRLDCDRFPTSDEGLQALRSEPADVRGWRGPYIERGIPADPWQNQYYYEDLGGDRYTLISYGPDGQPGNDDIGTEDDEGAVQ